MHFPPVARPGSYPALCPLEPGPSSTPEGAAAVRLTAHQVYSRPVRASTKTAVLLIAVFVALVGVAVAFLAPKVPTPPAVKTSTFPFAFTDDESVRVNLEVEPKRIVTFAPHFTEALFDFGSGAKVVGVSAADARPAEATAIPRPVSADGLTPDPAAIIALDPDVVITSLEGGEWKQAVRQAGIPVVTLRASGLEDAATDLRIVGRICGFPLSADKLAARLHRRFNALDRATVKARPRVFVETAYPPPATAQDPYMSELITAAGGVMLVAGPGYTVISGDQLQEMAPEVIVIGADPESPPERPEYARLTAAGTRLVYVPADLLFLPGPRLLEAIDLISRGIQGG